PHCRGRRVLGGTVNKTDLINQLAERLDGDKKAAQTAVEGFIDLVQREVQRGRNVSISGFGVFEKRARAARTARNPRTGEAVKVKKTTVPAFRPGKYFKDVISGTVKLPKATAKPTSARAAAAAAKATAPAAAAAKTTRAPRSTAAKPAAAPRTRAAAAKAAPAATATRGRAAAAKPVAAKTTATRATRASTAKAATTAKAPATRRTTAKASAK
ncbi:MAG TPA: HU family DNA-binding protein, partial [Nakamurella sp.]